MQYTSSGMKQRVTTDARLKSCKNSRTKAMVTHRQGSVWNWASFSFEEVGPSSWGFSSFIQYLNNLQGHIIKEPILKLWDGARNINVQNLTIILWHQMRGYGDKAGSKTDWGWLWIIMAWLLSCMPSMLTVSRHNDRGHRLGSTVYIVFDHINLMWLTQKSSSGICDGCSKCSTRDQLIPQIILVHGHEGLIIRHLQGLNIQPWIKVSFYPSH